MSLRPSLRRALGASAAATLLALSLAACGDDGEDANAGDAPSDASKDDFCDAWDGAFEDLTVAGEKPSEDEWKSFQDKVKELRDVGTPEDIPEKARNGFETFVRVVVETDYDSDEFEGGLPGASAADEADAEEFITYAVTTCTLRDLPTDLPTELPTE